MGEKTGIERGREEGRERERKIGDSNTYEKEQ